ncbi:MAG TPA: HNH endonuclease [Acidothermaceae bacterium]
MDTTKTTATDDNLAPLTLDDLATRIVAGAGRLAAATCAWLLLVADFDARDGAWKYGMASTPQWLSFHCGLAHRTAVEHLRVARALVAFPRMAEQMAGGRLSYSQARAIARTAKPGEVRLVDDLLEIARHGTVAQLEVMVRGLRTVDHIEHPAPRQEREQLVGRWGDDSMWALSARLDPERGALVDAAITKLADADGVAKVDALVRLAEIGLAALADADNPPRELRGDERAAVVIHLDPAKMRSDHIGTAALADASSEPDRPAARIDRGPGLPDAVVQRLLCDGRVRTLLVKDERVLDVGRTHRLVTRKQYRALLKRYGGHCAHPGCSNTKNLHAHHVIPWLVGGPTDLDNLIILCERHHVALHEQAFRVRKLGKGQFRFETLDGVDLQHPIAAPAPADMSSLDAEHPDVEPTAAATKWDGQRMQRDYAISVIAQRRYSATGSKRPASATG